MPSRACFAISFAAALISFAPSSLMPFSAVNAAVGAVISSAAEEYPASVSVFTRSPGISRESSLTGMPRRTSMSSRAITPREASRTSFLICSLSLTASASPSRTAVWFSVRIFACPGMILVMYGSFRVTGQAAACLTPEMGICLFSLIHYKTKRDRCGYLFREHRTRRKFIIQEQILKDYQKKL